MGRKFDEVSEEMKIVPYEVVKGPNDDVRVKAGGKEYAPPEISAMILQKLKTDAEAYLGESVTDAVSPSPRTSTTPSARRRRTPARSPASTSLRIINEPTAAALAYGLDKEGAEQTILVFDLGGGTFDVSVLELGDGVFEVKSTNGDNHLGGDNFDKAIVDWMVAEFKRDQGIDLAADPMALQRLYEAAEKAKIELCSTMATQINLPFITATPEGPKHLDLQLTRAKLEELAHDLLERTVGPTKQALADAGLDASKIDHVVLVGGMTRMPAVQAKVKELIGKEPHKGVNPDEVVAVGAAIQGGVLKGEVKDVLLLDVTPLSLGHRDQGRRVDEADRAQHDDPDPQGGDRSRPPRTTSRRSRSTCCRASPRWRRTTRRSASSSSSASRRRRGACRRSRSRSTSTRTGSSTSRRRTSAPATSSRSGSRAARASRRTRSSR